MSLKTPSFNEIIVLIEDSKQKAFSQVNSTLIELYWNIGQYISKKTIQEKWGKSIVQELAIFIKQKEPMIQGFSDKNLWRMKQFFETYKENIKLSPLVREITWTNNLLILSASKSEEEREFYIRISIKERYSKRELERQIKSGVYERTMLSNQKLSPSLKKLLQDSANIFRDIYSLEFLGLGTQHSENDLQMSLVTYLKEFILEIGKDFCFMGQLEFYLEALDRDVKKEYENPSIGVLLCRQKDDEVVEYALSRSLSPTVISQYETKLISKKVLRDKLNELYKALDAN